MVRVSHPFLPASSFSPRPFSFFHHQISMNQNTDFIQQSSDVLLCCCDGTKEAIAALDHAVKLAENTRQKLTVLYVTPLNPPSSLPYIDHLEKGYNFEIMESAIKDIEKVKMYLDTTVGPRIDEYEVVELEGEGEAGELIDEYVKDLGDAVKMVVVGTRNNGALKRWVFGSTSDYLVHHLSCPVLVVKH